jgi:hypothetical protein
MDVRCGHYYSTVRQPSNLTCPNYFAGCLPGCIPWIGSRMFPRDLPARSFRNARRHLDQADGLFASFGLDEMQPLIEWLKDRLPQVPCERPAVVHRDFHPGKILLSPFSGSQ